MIRALRPGRGASVGLAALAIVLTGAQAAVAVPAPPDGGKEAARPQVPVTAPLELPSLLDPKAGGSNLVTMVQRRSAEVEAAGEALSEQEAELSDLRVGLSERTETLAKLDETLTERQQIADRWARSAYMSARDLPANLTQTPALTSILPPSDGLDQTKDEVAAAREAYLADAEVERGFAAKVGGHHAQFDAAVAALNDLRTRHAAQLAAEEAILDARRMQVGSQILGGLISTNSKGMMPGPAAVRALSFALAQRGKPYVWGAEGLDSYDCSGLVQRSYSEAGVSLPRTARPQWRGTTPIAPADMIPGDLLFFATNASNWNTIHHVAIYLGGGRMLHAPTTGDVVKISPVWWEEFFGATRVVPAVPGSNRPKPPPPGTPKPRTTQPPPAPTPGPTHSASPSPSPSTPPPTPPVPTETPSTPPVTTTPPTPPSSVTETPPTSVTAPPPGSVSLRARYPLGVAR